MPQRALRKKQWKTSQDVERLVISKDASGRPIRLGGGVRGEILMGRLRFNGKIGAERARTSNLWRRVAVKKFRSPLTDEQARLYQQAICRLRKAGVRLPKMAMVKHNGEWLLVSQLFGSTSQSSKIAHGTLLAITTPCGRLEAVREFARVANAGYCGQEDAIEQFKKPEKGAILIDLDGIAIQPTAMAKATAEDRANFVAYMVEQIAKYSDNAEHRGLWAEAMRTASPEMRRALARVSPAWKTGNRAKKR